MRRRAGRGQLALPLGPTQLPLAALEAARRACGVTVPLAAALASPSGLGKALRQVAINRERRRR